MEDFPRISAVVLHFNNGEHIYKTLESILCQDYPNIELLISDDCSIDGFDVDQVIKFINSNRKDNLKRTIININETNLGTVKNLETIRMKETGEFELLIAADDIWSDETVFSSFVQRFEELGSEAEWIISQTEMRDENLEKKEGLFVKNEIEELIQQKAFKKLLSAQAAGVYLPSAGVAYRRTFFEKINNLSSSYFLVEDYPTHIRALRLGIPVYYLDKITVYHRSGGVSHGNKRNLGGVYALYIKDMISIFENEVLPFKELFSADDYARANVRYTWYRKHYKTLPSVGTIREVSPTKAIRFRRFITDFVIALKPRLGLLTKMGKIKNDVLVLAGLLFCLSLIQLSDNFFFSKAEIVFAISFLFFLVLAILFVRILSIVLVLIINRIDTIEG